MKRLVHPKRIVLFGVPHGICLTELYSTIDGTFYLQDLYQKQFNNLQTQKMNQHRFKYLEKETCAS